MSLWLREELALLRTLKGSYPHALNPATEPSQKDNINK